MTTTDVFCYYISNRHKPVNENAEAWQSVLPFSRSLETGSDEAFQASVTCGEYFLAVQDFLSAENFQVITQAVSAGFKAHITPKDIAKIHVILIKHGEFYHPSKVEVDTLSGDHYIFILNVAVSENGQALIAEEYTNLNSLDLLFSYPFLPEIYFLGAAVTEKNRELSMFLAQWCHRHHEFHWSRLPDGDELRIMVWDDAKGNYFLDQEQTVTVFSRMAMILTSYYNFSSSHHISMWHNAAGDFVVCPDDNDMSVKLISVRQYVPLIDLDESDLWTLLETLFVFFISLSIRIRLDRLDGVGKTVWGNEEAVIGMVEGFLMGLHHQTANELIPEELFEGIKMYLQTFSEKNILDWCTDIAKQIYANSPDLNLILSHMDSHAHQLHYYTAHYLADKS